MSDVRIFTLEEAQAMVPALARLVGRQIELGTEIEGHLSRLRGLAPPTSARVADALAVRSADPAEVRSLKRAITERVQRYEGGWKEVQEMGVVVKDPRTGLLDFYGKIDGRTVFLCWRFGERAIGHFHELDAGFSGRRPLDGAVKSRLLN